ncbi:HipA domain-containing protein [Vibrio genomosp. F6]|uniref:type II toxin-antitoxin system HipA family toxin n=1 Tax=Vibrio TaxID=662 RepID=UPI000DE97131|nr:HipA domain-containing protein [Vibrio genomosp. F6]RBW64930.1 type II toxin-antitoxin system HipA family toxin [Vibrionales bacterium C3R12]TKF17285.1 HipA domain-containing protein [Vibrio genomosp. F6]
MYPSNRSLISLTLLDDSNRDQQEYKKGEIKDLLGSNKYQMRLPFTRTEFVTELPKKQKGMSISGYQPKLSLTINEENELGVVENKALFILKPSPVEFPNLAENEHATMLVMKMLGFDIPPFGLVRFKGDESDSECAFIIRRYDRLGTGEKAIHQEQLDAAMNVREKYGKIKDDDEGYVSYEQACLFLIKNVDSSLLFKRDLFQRVLAAYYLGNNDLHLRNIGLLLPEKEASQLAPIYDYVSIAPYPDYIANETSLALPLLANEEGDNGNTSGYQSHCTYTGYDFLMFAENIGIKPKLATKLIKEICGKKEVIYEIYRNSFMPEEQIDKVIQWVESRTNYLHQLEHVDIHAD